MADKVVIPFIGDSTQLNNELRKVERNVERTAQKTNSLFSGGGFLGTGIKVAAGIQAANLALRTASVGADIFNGKLEDTVDTLKQLPIGLGQVAASIEMVYNKFGGFTQTIDEIKAATAAEQQRQAVFAASVRMSSQQLFIAKQQTGEIEFQTSLAKIQDKDLAQTLTRWRQIERLITSARENMKRAMDAAPTGAAQDKIREEYERQIEAIIRLGNEQDRQAQRERDEDDRAKILSEQADEQERLLEIERKRLELSNKLKVGELQLMGRDEEAQALRIKQTYEDAISEALLAGNRDIAMMLTMLMSQEIQALIQAAEAAAKNAENRVESLMQKEIPAPRFMGLQEAAREFATSQLGGPDLQKQQLDEAKKQVAEQKKTVEVLRELGNKIGGPAVFAE
jgi:hypothetical protein